MAGRPVGGAALGVVRVERGGVVLALIAEHTAKVIQAPPVAHQLVPVKMAGFVAQMANEGAVGLAQRDAAAGALVIIGFRHVERDGAAVVARQYGRAARPFRQKCEHRPGPARRGLQPQTGQGVEQQSLGRLDLHPAPQMGCVREIRQHPGLAARRTQFVVIVGGYRKIAGLVPAGVQAQAVQPPAVLRGAALAPAPPQVCAVLRRRGQRCHGQLIRQKGQRAAALQALHTVEKHQVTAMVAIEDTHGWSLYPARLRDAGNDKEGRCQRSGPGLADGSPPKKTGPGTCPGPALTNARTRVRCAHRTRGLCRAYQGRTTMLLRTSRTCLVLRAMLSAWFFSAWDLAKPDS